MPSEKTRKRRPVITSKVGETVMQFVKQFHKHSSSNIQFTNYDWYSRKIDWEKNEYLHSEIANVDVGISYYVLLEK